MQWGYLLYRSAQHPRVHALRIHNDSDCNTVSGLTVGVALNTNGNVEEMEEIKMFQDFTIPDNIINQYLSQYPLQKFFDNQDWFNQKTRLEYKYNDLTYMSKVYNYHYGFTGRQLTIKLLHDGFRYVFIHFILPSHSILFLIFMYRYAKRSFLQANLQWHETGGFFILDDSILNEMPFLKSLKDKEGAMIVFYYRYAIVHFMYKFCYSIKHRLMDIKFKKGDSPYLMFTFEPGKPVHIEDDSLCIWEAY